jgi:hypothetical protein
MKNFFNWLLERFNERSTWVGLTGMLTAIGVGLSPEQLNVISTVGVGTASAILAFSKDKK